MASWLTEFGDSFSSKKVMVTGSSGFIGSHLRDALLMLGATVYGLNRSVSSVNDNEIHGFQNRVVDLTNLNELKITVSEIRPDIIYHLAGKVTGQQDTDLVLPMLQNNLLGTANLLLIANELGCRRLVITASAEEPIDGVPASPYAASKSAAILYAKMFFHIYNLPVVIARLSMVYGPRQPADKLIPYSIHSLLRNQAPQLGSGERIVDFVYILDIIRGLLMAGVRSGVEGKVIEFGTGTGVKIKDAIGLLVDIINNSFPPPIATKIDRRQEKHFVSNPEVAYELLGWKPQWLLQDGLKETVAWYQEINRRREL